MRRVFDKIAKFERRLNPNRLEIEGGLIRSDHHYERDQSADIVQAFETAHYQYRDDYATYHVP